MRSLLCAVGCAMLVAAALAPAIADSPADGARGTFAQAATEDADAPDPEARTTVPDGNEAPPQNREPAAPDASDAPPEGPPEPSTQPTEEATGPDAAAESGELTGDGTAPAPDDTWRGEPDEERVLIDADEVYYQSGVTIAKGNVVVRYRDIVVTADEAEIDENGEIAMFHGNVVITRDDIQTTAELIRLNLETEEWEIVGGRTTLEPDFFERGVAEPIFVHAESISGAEADEVITATNGVVTSCDLEEPHYGLVSRRIRLIGDDKVVLERPELRILGNRILRYPWDLVLSQTSPNNRFFPEFGQNTVEGYYLKLAYLYLTNSTANSYLKLHVTENRGVGFGLDHYYRLGAHSGSASVFFQPEERAISGRARDSWEIAQNLTSNFNLNLQQNSGFSGATTQSLAGNMTLRLQEAMFTTTLGFDTSSTDSAFSSSDRWTTNLSHRQRMPGDASFDLRAVLRRSDFGSGRAADETLETDFQYQDRGSWYDWALAAERRWDFEGEQPGFGLDRLPEIVFNTDSRRLGDWKLLGIVPVRAQARAGHFVQHPDEEEVSMASMETDLGGDRIELGDNYTLTAAGTFDQAVYSEGSAQFNVGTRTSLEGDLGAHWFARLAHSYATVEGFSPLRRSYSGKYNDLTFSLVRQVENLSRFELTGGYDFFDERWRELRLRGYMTPSDRDRIELVAGFSLDRSLWRPLQVRWTHATPSDLYMALSSRYDLDDGKLSDADLELDWRLDRKWRLQALTTWSGYRGEIDEMNLRLERDLHCWTAALTYNKELDELRLNLGIKAFPSEARDWTLGRGGARLGSYQQVYY